MMYADIIRDENGTPLAWVAPARQETVDAVLASREGTGNGRSEWVWVRLANGDLFLSVAPQGNLNRELQGEPGTTWGDGPPRWVPHNSDLHRRLVSEGWRIISDDGQRFCLDPPSASARSAQIGEDGDG